MYQKTPFLLLVLFFPTLILGQGLDTLQLRTIFDEPYLTGVRPVFNSFSPDERRIYFDWNDSSLTQRKHYSVNLSGGDLTEYKGDQFIGSSMSPDGNMLAYFKDQELWISDAEGENARPLVSSELSNVNPVWSSDSRQIAFVRDGDVWVAGVDEPQIRQLTRKQHDEPDYRIEHWSGDSRHIITVQFDTSDYQELYFPEYIDKFVEPGKTTRGQALVTITSFDTDSLKSHQLLQGVVFPNNITGNKTGNLLAVDYLDNYMKERTVRIYDLENQTSEVIFQEVTEGWIYPQLSSLEFAPNDDVLLLTSEQDGWAHIYTMDTDGSNLVQHTEGNYEVPWASWKDDKTIVFASTEVDPGERQVYLLALSSGEKARITQVEGYRDGFSLSPSRRYLVYNKSFWNQPSDIHLLDLNLTRRSERRLTESVPERFKAINWQVPEYIRFTSRDGETPVSMTVLKPDGFDAEQKYPVIVFAHGAGSLQNVYKGWSNHYFREYMFHQYLNKHGYVVVDVDFRHSTGYGRKFREDVTNWMGRYETKDIIDALDYLDANGGYVDLDQVGIYGGSYGGFLALYAVSVAPERFMAGAALRKVTNWENYYYANPWYTGPRLGHPDEDREHYERSSPLTYADSLTRPVLLLHGLIDDNVGFQDAMQYVEVLIQSGNVNFELMVYPSERHAFQSPNSWIDEYSRIFGFFNKHLIQQTGSDAHREALETE